MTETPKEMVPNGTSEGGEQHNERKLYSGALPPDLAELDAAVKQRIDSTLNSFEFVLARLRSALEAHAIEIEEGSLEHRELSANLRHFMPILTATVHQENKVHETIEQRVGKAGKYAIDLKRARSEIHGRLSRILEARGSDRLSRKPE